MNPRRNVDVDAYIAIDKRSDGLLVDAAGCDRRESGLRDRHLVSKTYTTGFSHYAAQRQAGQQLGVAVLFEQAESGLRKIGDEEIRFGQKWRSIQRQVLRLSRQNGGGSF